jgi:signal transduction histidine kinase
MRPTVRLRLTAWYASIFLLGGGVLLAISYAIVSRNTTNFPTRVGERLRAEGAVTRVVVGPPAGAPPPTLRITGPDRQTLVRLERARQAAERQVTADIHRQTAIDFALALVGTTLVSLLAGWMVAGRALRPVARITATARKVAAEGDLGERIALEGPADELRELADTFDVMLERLDRTFASQKSFVANASHELRTPLAVMRAEIEERLDDPSASEDELREMAVVVHDAVGRSEALITSLFDACPRPGHAPATRAPRPGRGESCGRCPQRAGSSRGRDQHRDRRRAGALPGRPGTARAPGCQPGRERLALQPQGRVRSPRD